MIEDVKNQGRTGIDVNFLIGSILLAVIIAYHFFGFGLVTSGSMEPALKKDDLVLIRKYGDYEPGDIVVRESGDSLVVHRVTGIDGDMVITQGDANSVPDEPFTADSIKGVVLGRICSFPSYPGSQLLARFVAESSGSSTASVAIWDVSALDEPSDTLQLTSADAEYPDDGYEFSVRSDSETTAGYNIDIKLYDETGDVAAEEITAGLFQYDDDADIWALVSESSGGELSYEGILPVEWSIERFRLCIRTSGEGTAGNYKADIDVDVTQID